MIDVAEGENMKPEVLGPESEIYNKNNQIRPNDPLSVNRSFQNTINDDSH